MASAMKGATRVSDWMLKGHGYQVMLEHYDLSGREFQAEQPESLQTLPKALTTQQAMGQMNRSLNLPQIQKIMNDFEKESATMDMKEDMMSEAVDDAMDDEAEGEGEEEEGDRILKEVLDEIGVGLGQSVSEASERCEWK